MKEVFRDQTQTVFSGEGPGLIVVDSFILLMVTLGLGSSFFFLFFTETDIPSRAFLAIGAMLTIHYLWLRVFWLVRFFSQRVRLIYRTNDGNLLIKRGYPCQDINLAAGANISYNVAPGNFRLDLMQRGNAPHGLNIWFECEQGCFWFSEASGNYREALTLLANHAVVRQDVALHQWERYLYWARWREHHKQRQSLPVVMDEIHQLLISKD